MSHSLDQLLWAIDRRRLVLAPETAGALLLSVAEQSQANPRLLPSSDVSVVEAGSVHLGDGPPTTQLSCDLHLRNLLSELLQRCSSEHEPLQRVAAGPGRSCVQLTQELTTALVPFNRSAARRALQRLHRRLAAAGPPPRPQLARGKPAVPPVAPAVAEARRVPVECLRSAPPPAACTREPLPAVSQAVLGSSQDSELTAPLGSLQVVVRDPSPAPAGSTAPVVAVGLPARPVSKTPRTLPEEPTAAPSEDEAGLAFGRFASRRSTVSDLVDRFAMETASGDQLITEQLRRCLNPRELGVCTPAPQSVAPLSTDEVTVRL